ncbi:MAG: GNAT family N-acetyltransferase [Alphaproteobacteria bacterium]
MGDSEQSPFLAGVRHAIRDVPAAEWDACAGGDNPFTRHAFLLALEESGSATAETGWAPHHLVVEDPTGRIAGVAPLYLKSHSFGEYVFDHGWADAFERVGGRYYPKLQMAVPFTPVTGARLMARPGRDATMARRALIAGAVELTRRTGVSSLHVTFPTEAEWRLMGEAGFLKRTGCQFHWRNEGYARFDDFLARLVARKRKALRRERRAALSTGLTIEVLSGDDIKSKHWDAFFTCYIATSERKWGYPYLTRAFFEQLGATMAEHIVLMMAKHDDRYVAAAFNMLGGNALYGRNWGATEYHPFLHFELCYYRAIDFAIERGVARVEAGAQGPHKIARGYLPAPTYSAHWVRHPGLRDAIARFLSAERKETGEEIEFLGGHAPFRKTEP